jgi:sentrin-specific protease 1
MLKIKKKGNHWILSVINIRDKRYEYYDSMNGNSYKTIFENYKKYLKEEEKDKKVNENKINTDKFEYYVPKDITPQQRNGYDCGVFTCIFSNYVSQDIPFNFDQSFMSYFRKKLVLNILNKNII